MKKEFAKAHGTTIKQTATITKIQEIPHSTWFQINEAIFYKDFEGKFFYLVGRCKIEPCTNTEIVDFRASVNLQDSPYILLEPTEFAFKIKL